MWSILHDAHSSIDVDVDIGLIITSLAPSILIIVTYYYAKKKTDENHNTNVENLRLIKTAVNGRLTDALKRLEKLEESSKSKLKRIEKLEKEMDNLEDDHLPKT